MRLKKVLSLVLIGLMLLTVTAFAADSQVKIELSKFVYARMKNYT
ncbi:MAG: hypothetical protein WCX81_03795 [Monoglobales bacterium]